MLGDFCVFCSFSGYRSFFVKIRIFIGRVHASPDFWDELDRIYVGADRFIQRTDFSDQFGVHRLDASEEFRERFGHTPIV